MRDHSSVGTILFNRQCRSLENGKVAVLRTVVILCIWVAAMGLIGDLALHAHGLGSSALLAVAAASAVAILG
jgi:hypothetical protein